MLFTNDLVPDVWIHQRVRDESIGGENPYKWERNLTSDLFAGKRVLVFGLPGAFTPTCTNEQLPGFERKYEDLMDLGIDEVYCTSVNDAFVMNKWAKDLGIEKVKMLPDGCGDFAQGMGMLVDKSNLGFGKRSWRYACVIDDLVITNTWEEDGFSNNCPSDPYVRSQPERVINTLRGSV